MKRLAVCVAVLIGCSQGPEREIDASGTIEGTDVNISAEVSGKLKEVRLEEGARVKLGDTLAVIDDTDYRLQLQQAVANQDAAEAQYKLALAGSRKEDVIQAEATFKNADADYERMKNLLASKTITQKQYDDALARYVSAQQTFEKLSRGLRPEEIAAARARRDQARAQVDQLVKRVNDCNIVSPVDGTITLRSVERGELITTGSNLFRVTYLDKVKLTIYVNETELAKVRLGQKAKVTVDTYKAKAFDGEVVYISPSAEFTPKNIQTKEERTKLVFAVKILVNNPDGRLKPGLPADAVLKTD